MVGNSLTGLFMGELLHFSAPKLAVALPASGYAQTPSFHSRRFFSSTLTHLLAFVPITPPPERDSTITSRLRSAAIILGQLPEQNFLHLQFSISS